MINIFLVLLTNIKFIKTRDVAIIPEAPAPYPESLAKPSVPCTEDNKTYTIDVKIHVEESVIHAILAVAKSSIAANETEREAISGYFGTIFDELNDMLMSLKVQLHLKLDAYSIEEFMSTISVDPSCEKASPVQERTTAAFDYLQSAFESNIGIHVFVWGCIYVPPNSEYKTTINSYRCGRVAGVLWEGMDASKGLIMNAIIGALVGLEHLRVNGVTIADTVGRQLCQYVHECIGMTKSQLGQIVGGTTPVRYTDSEELASPAEAEAVIEYNVLSH